MEGYEWIEVSPGRKRHIPLGGDRAAIRRKVSRYPLHSDALGCNPDQRQASCAEARRHGVPTEFDHEGRAVLTSSEHHRKYARLYGMEV